MVCKISMVSLIIHENWALMGGGVTQHFFKFRFFGDVVVKTVTFP